MLLREYGTFENCPLEISGQVLETESMVVNETGLQRMKFLNFLGKGTSVNLVEVDISGVLSKSTMDTFASEVAKRNGARRGARAREERILREMEKRSRQEGEANQSLMFYYEKPQIHPAAKPVNPFPKREESSDEEPSKSIWGNLEEVLRNPIPPKVREEAKEEEAKDETRVTLFDLIKYKTKR